MSEQKRIQYAPFLYTDDSGKQWAVTLRKRGAVVGGFTSPAPEDLNPSGMGIFRWTWQNLDMRHITVKTEDNKILRFPCATTDAVNFNRVGQSVEFSRWDFGIDDGELPSESVVGKIISRHGESIEGKPYPHWSDGTPA